MADVVVHGPELIGPTTMLVGAHPLKPGFWFPTHAHAHPQILWTSRGVLAVAACDQRWVLPPTRALWVPSGTVHRTGSSRGALVHSVYVSASHAPGEWHQPTLLAVRPLLAELIRHLACEDLPTEQRTRAEAVLLDLLDPLPSAPLEVHMPTDPRAAAVAQALHANPADDRSLAAFARSASTSPRTLSRLFITETGLSFDRWRTGIRMWAALPLAAVFPAFLELKHEAVRRRIEPGRGDLARPEVIVLTHPDEIFYALGLDAPGRHADVEKRIRVQ